MGLIADGEPAGLESAAVEAVTILVEALAEYFAAADDDGAVAMVEGRLRCLL